MQHCAFAENISDFAEKAGSPLAGRNTEGLSARLVYLGTELDTMAGVSNNFFKNYQNCDNFPLKEVAKEVFHTATACFYQPVHFACRVVTCGCMQMLIFACHSRAAETS